VIALLNIADFPVDTESHLVPIAKYVSPSYAVCPPSVFNSSTTAHRIFVSERNPSILAFFFA